MLTPFNLPHMAGYSNSTVEYIDIVGIKKHNLLFIALQNICSFTIIYFLCNLSVKARAFLYYYKVPLDQATHVILNDQYGNIKIIKIQLYRINGIKEEEEKQGQCYSSLILQRYIAHNINAIKILDTPYSRFIYDFQKNQFVVPKYTQKIINEMTQLEKRIIFGSNFVDIKIYDFLEIFKMNFFEITVLWELAAIIVWLWISYIKYAAVVGIIYVAIFVQNLINDIKENNKMREKFIKDSRITVKKKINSIFVEISCKNIYPGDVILVEPTAELCCDAKINKGDVITDESFLTGESVPICKGAGDFIYAGTKIVKSSQNEQITVNQANSKLIRLKNLLDTKPTVLKERKCRKQIKETCINIDHAEATVTNTGRRTKKGVLVKNLLIKNKPLDKFKNDTFYVSLITMGITIFIFIVFVFYLKDYVTLKKAIIFPIDIFFTIFSPTFFTCAELGFMKSKESLKKAGIFCKDKSRIMIAGNVEIGIFDKTGTLTEIGLDVKLIDVLEETDLLPDGTISDILDISRENPQEKHNFLRIALSTCHSILELDGKYSGDVLDIKMFLFAQASIFTDKKRKMVKISALPAKNEVLAKEFQHSENEAKVKINSTCISNASEERNNCTLFVARNSDYVFDPDNPCVIGEIVETFEFNSFLKKMSVVVQINCDYFLFCKGAPEMVKKDLKEIPQGYNEKVQDYAIKGYRILTIAYRKIEGVTEKEKGGFKKMRDNLEKGLQFLGFIVFANKMKEETPRVIRELKNADIKTKMCTGDSILTAISVAKECEMVARDLPVLFPVFREESEKGVERKKKSFFENDVEEELQSLDWLCVAEDNYIFDKVRLCLYSEFDDNTEVDFAIAVESREYTELMERIVYRNLILEKGIVFARFDPELKKHLVEEYSKKNNVLFCGDGANDAGALSAADVGLLLSDGKANLVSPFSSESLLSVIALIQEGRGALVSGMSQFKYIFYSQALAGIQLLVLLINFNFPSDGMSLFGDLLSCYGLGYIMLLFNKSDKLTKERPLVNIYSHIKVITIELFAISLIYWVATSFFIPTGTCLKKLHLIPEKDWDKNVIKEESEASTIIFYVTLWLLVIKAVYFADYGGFKQSRLSNFRFLTGVFLFIFISFVIFLANYKNVYFVCYFLELTELKQQFFRYFCPLILICTIITGIFSVTVSNVTTKLN
ncbi:hypothetical protein NUSPORA_01800 [Nucleospora cyclopteri]